MLSVSIIIPTHNRLKYLHSTLSELKRQITKINEAFFGIIVVVDGSIDGTIEMLKSEFQNVHIVQGDGTWWYTKSMNEGFKFAHRFNPDYVLALNDDVILEKNYLKNLLKVSKEKGENSIIGSFSYVQSDSPRVFFSGIKRINNLTFKQYPYIKRMSIIEINKLKGTFPSRTLPGRGMLIPYDVLQELNYFDELFPQYGSDDDFVLRAWESGYKAYISFDCRIISLPEYTSKGAAINHPSFIEFIKNMFFNKYASTYFLKESRKIYRHGNKLLLLISIPYQFFATFYSFVKYKIK